MDKNIFHYHMQWQNKSMESDRLYMQERVFKTLQSLFLKILNSEFKGRILDVGFGDGSFIQICAKHGLRAQGVDICHGINFETDRLPYEDSTFDIAIMYSVIEHLYSPCNILTEIRRVLRPKGKLIIITTNFELDNFLLCGRDFFDDPTHIHPYNRKSLRMLLKMYDFKERFLGLWVICKSHKIWKLPETLQFYYGAFLPFKGTAKYAPGFLKGRSRGILSVFEKP